MSHSLKMVLGCLLPVVMIFLLPVLGLGSGATMLVAVALMFVCHLLMMRGHGGRHHDQ